MNRREFLKATLTATTLPATGLLATKALARSEPEKNENVGKIYYRARPACGGYIALEDIPKDSYGWVQVL